MQLHQLQPKHQNKRTKVVGRGGKRGKTSGKGGKGQTARAGHRVRPEIRDVIKKLPKLRGYNAPRIGKIYAIINVGDLEKKFEAGAVISPKNFREAKMKILGSGGLTKSFTLTGFSVSKGAKAKIEKAGGTVEQNNG
ncbi:MAG TPA: uL15 family ribosomal protein [Candidatus Paceibacterota bacterium]